MSTKVRQTGYVDAERNIGKRTALVTSIGSTILVVSDPNNSTAAAGYGDATNATKIYIYESTNANKTTWALRATINNPAGTTIMDNTEGTYSADLFQDDSVAVVFKCNDGQFYYVKVTYGTWAVSTAVVAASNTGPVTFQALDVAVSEGGAVMLAAYYTTATSGNYAGVRLYLRRTTAGTWAQVNTQLVSGAAAVLTKTWDVSFVWTKSGTATAREFAYAFCSTTSATDNGVVLFRGTVDEQAGSAVTGHTSIGTFTQGDVSKSVTYSLKARSIMLFSLSGSTMDITLTTQTYYPKPKFNAVRWQKLAGVWTNITPITSYGSGFNGTLASGGMAQAAGTGTITFITNANSGNGWDLTAYLLRFVGNEGRWGAGYFYFDNKSYPNPYHPQGGTGQWANQAFNHDIVFGRRLASNKYDWQHAFVVANRAPQSHTPAGGGIIDTSTPALSAVADLDRAYGQGRVKIVWQFATDAGFTTNLRTYIEDDDKFSTVDGTGAGGKTVVFRDTLPTSLELFQGLWYVRAAHVSEYGLTSSYDAATSFTVSHPPALDPKSPDNNAQIVYGTGGVRFEWDYSDPYVDDYQSAFQVLVEKISDGSTLYDSGKVISGDHGWTKTFVSGDKDIPLRWKSRAWDSDDVVGVYSDYATFTVIDPPAVTFTTPASGSTVTSALPDTTIVPTVGGGRTISKVRLVISQGNTTVYDSQWIAGTWVSGTPIDIDSPLPVLKNTTAYTYTARVVDNVGMEGRSNVSITTNWILPPATDTVAVDVAPYNVEDLGYIKVVWVEATPDADFRAWIIMRRDRLVDPISGATLEETVWTEVGREYDINIWEFHDYYAPSGYQCDYDVLQMVDRFGDQVTSAVAVRQTISPKSEGYWFINPTVASSNPDAFKLSSVVADSYTDEYEQDVMVIAGGGRKVDTGERIGKTGQMTVHLRDSSGQSARQKKKRLEILKEVGGPLYLRTPFGDMYRVAIGNPAIERIPGVGTSEFVNVTIPYMEVGE